MKTIIAAAVVVAAAALAAPAFAAPTVSLGYTQATEKVAGVDIDLGVLRGAAAYDFNKNFGVEGEAGFGVKNETISGQKIKLDYEVAAYLTAKAPITPQFDVFARGGFGNTKISTSGTFGSGDQTFASWNYGAGAEYLFDGKNGVRADYTKYDGDGFDVDAWTVAYVRKF